MRSALFKLLSALHLTVPDQHGRLPFLLLPIGEVRKTGGAVRGGSRLVLSQTRHQSSKMTGNESPRSHTNEEARLTLVDCITIVLIPY